MKILVIDDHGLIREALRGVFREVSADAVVLEAASSHRALRLAEENPDINLATLDLNLPDRNGFDVLAELRGRHPALCVVVLSADQDRQTIAHALELGALGFIPKSASREIMISAFNLIFSGGIYVPPEILAEQPLATEAPASARPPLAVDASRLGLTERQMEVLALVMQGKSNKAICRILDLAEPTVKNHVTAILRALKATNRTEAVIAAAALGFSEGHSGNPPSGR